ncbi:conserved hypothetical protein [Neospora caninum Liverpool]|nr:conserved hypothetical protein [Neospora caninum Liverpool]CBZ56316.1 conserved hypothetical protein [Neospora caninum Liverpool]|eukprot:XP_003886341.1 conserved hypothetical protein [Neospora caninum Liverpool]
MKEFADRSSSFSLLSSFFPTVGRNSDADAALHDPERQRAPRESVALEASGEWETGGKRHPPEDSQAVQGYESDEDKSPVSTAALEASEKGKLLANLRALLSFVLDKLRVPPQHVFFSANKLAAGPVIELCSFADLFFNGNNSFGGLILIEPLLVPDLGQRNGARSSDRLQLCARLSLPVRLTFGSDEGDEAEKGSPPFAAESYTLSARTGDSSGMPSPTACSVAPGGDRPPTSSGAQCFKDTLDASKVADTLGSQHERPKAPGDCHDGETPAADNRGCSQVTRKAFPERPEDPRFLRRASCSDSSMSTISHKAGRLTRADCGKLLGVVRSVCNSDACAAGKQENAGEYSGTEREGALSPVLGRSDEQLVAPGAEPSASEIPESSHGLQSSGRVEHLHSPIDPEIRFESGTTSTASFSQSESCSDTNPVLEGSCQSESRSASFENRQGESGLSAQTNDAHSSLPTEPHMHSDIQKESLLPHASDSQGGMFTRDQNAAETDPRSPCFRLREPRNNQVSTGSTRGSVRGNTGVSVEQVMLTGGQATRLGQFLAGRPEENGALSAPERTVTARAAEKTGRPAALLCLEPTTAESGAPPRSPGYGEGIVEGIGRRDVSDTLRRESDFDLTQESSVIDSMTDSSQDEQEQDEDGTFLSLVRKSFDGTWSAPREEAWDNGRQEVPFFSQFKQFFPSGFVDDLTEPEEGGRTAAIAQAAREESRRLSLAKDKKIAQELPAAFGIKKAAAHIREVSCPLLLLRRDLFLHLKPHMLRRGEADTSDASSVMAGEEDDGNLSDGVFSDTTSQSQSETEEEDCHVFTKEVLSDASESSVDSTTVEVVEKPLNIESRGNPVNAFGGRPRHQRQQIGAVQGQATKERFISRRHTEKHLESKDWATQRSEGRREERAERREARRRAEAYVKSVGPRDRKALKQEEASADRIIKLLSNWAVSADKATVAFRFYDTGFYKTLSRFINETPSHISRPGMAGKNKRNSLTPASAAALFARRAEQHLRAKWRGRDGRRRCHGERADQLEGICIPLHMFEVPPAYRQNEVMRKNSHESTDSTQGDSWIDKAISAYTSYFDFFGSNSGTH